MTYVLEDCTMKVLKIHKSIVIENFKPLPLCPIKWQPFNVSLKITQTFFLIANTVKGAVSALRSFVATKSL